MLSVLGIIPARCGSKGIIHKNKCQLGGQSLVRRAEDSPIRAGIDYVVSTDCYDVEQGVLAETLVRRPTELAQDDTPMIDVLQHAMAEVNVKRDAVMTLQPTTPFRSAEDITNAIEIMERTGCDSVISFVDVGSKHPARMASIDDDGRVAWLHSRDRFARRQELPPRFIRAGSIYLTRWEVLEQGSIEGDDCRALIVPPERAINIDTPEDLAEARRMVES